MTALDALPLWSLTTLYAVREKKKKKKHGMDVSSFRTVRAFSEVMMVSFEISLYYRFVCFSPIHKHY